ncbi:MAG: hypothetical protein K2F65_06115, partial [Eubacterium sp.]|nr:hypothetical protein [Eubacterium sp.]
EEWLPVFGYHDRWKKLSLDDFSFEYKNDYIVNDKGYRIYSGIKSPKKSDYEKGSQMKANVPFFNKYYLESIKKMCEENGAELMLVSIPSIKDWNLERHNSAAKLSEALRIQYMDMNMMSDEISIDWSRDSRDGGEHLNQIGAEKVTSYFGEFLHSKNIFADRRDDEKLAHWFEAYKTFLEKAEKIKAKDLAHIKKK